MEALDAAVRAARRHGLRVDEPVVVRDLTNVLVRLDPSPFIARVPMTLGPVRGREWVELEVRAVAWLAERGAPVAPPASAVDPGPHAEGAFLVTFWDAFPHDPDRADPTAAGRTLHELHATLEGLQEPLPTFDRLDEVGRLLEALRPSDVASQEDLQGLKEVRELLAAQPLPALRPIHGDAHLSNVLWTPDGPLWSDFENLCLGPVEYDLACISWRREFPKNVEALAAYGPYDEELLARMDPYLALFLTPWTIRLAERHPSSIAEEARRRVARALEPLQRMG